MSVFKSFTNCYALSKTLRFELKPVGKTFENMRTQLAYNKDLQTFLKDQAIEDAYQKLKPLFDKLHEEFITDSLDSDQAKKIDFSEYLVLYEAKKELQAIEKKLREEIGKTFIAAGEKWKQEKYAQYTWKKGSKVANGSDILLTQDVLELIRHLNDKNEELKKMIEETFKGFFTYLSGFNQNRKNYYTIKEEKATAVATRIVHENLPKFCDNILFFIDRQTEYLIAHSFLKEKGRDLVNKDGKALLPITDSIFSIEHFNHCFSQKQIEAYNAQIGNANVLINLYNQAHNDEQGFKRLPAFKTLYKQIGCGKRKSLFFTLTCDTEAEASKMRNENKEAFSVEEVLNLAYKAGEKYFQNSIENDSNLTIPKFCSYIEAQQDYDGIYWSKAALNTISNKYFANYHVLKDRLKEVKVFQKAAKGSEEDVKIPEAIELEGLFAVIDEVDGWRDEDIFFKKSLIEERKDEKENKKNKKRLEVIKKAEKPSQALINLIFFDINEHIEQFFDTSKAILSLQEYKSKESKEAIKAWMDHALAVNQILKYFLVKENKTKGNPLDSEISNALKNILFEGKIIFDGKEIDVDWFRWYDALRNYLTKKPQDDAKENKLKLNFRNSTLAGGWDINKEPDNYCVILQDQNDKQYLGVIAKKEKQRGYNKIFEKTPENPLYKIDSGEVWQKMEYKQIAAPTGIGGFVRKCFKTAQQYGWKCPDNCLNSEGKIIIKNDEAKENLEAIIDCYKDFFIKYEKDGFSYKKFSFNFKKSSEYEELNNFFSDVERQGYKLDFTTINKAIIDQWVEDGTIYLFEIKNQDANDGKKEGHKNNLHTIYWKALFENNEDKPKLNGGAELFYRKALPKSKQEKIKDNHGKEIIKNFRFSKEKFLFHCPIKMNYKAKSYSDPKYALTEINNQINEALTTFGDIHFLGIDRGEKHLAYYWLVDKNGEMIDQGTLNLPFIDQEGKPRSIKKPKYFYNKKKDKWESEEINCWDYNDLLDAMASNRDMARKNWQTIGTIKELKEGYISQVVHKIADIVVKHGAFIVLEDLNTGFKRGRQKIEKSVYQKFELALAKKLNFLVDKSAKSGEIGSVTRALQLTPPVNNYGDIEKRKQVGIMLYTRANYTSQTDPETGWRKIIYLKKGNEEAIKEQILQNFTDIWFDGLDYYFEYPNKNKSDKPWKLYSGKGGKSLDRFRRSRGKDKNEWTIEPVNVVNILKQVFVNFDEKRSLRSQIIEGKALARTKEKTDFTAWEALRFAIDLIQQIRNTGNNEKDADFLHSPVRDTNGNHFDSRSVSHDRPTSGDANGAYNIARKGLMMNEHIRTWAKKGKPKYDKNTNDLNLFISEEEWDLYLADKKAWQEKLLMFSSRKAMDEEKKKHI